MANGYGGKRKNSGRKAGGANTLRAEAEKLVDWTGETPAECMQRMMQDPKLSDALRLDAAKAGALFVHRKQPEMTEVSMQVTVPAPIIVLHREE